MEQSIRDQVVDECKKNISTILNIGQLRARRNSSNAPHWSIEQLISVSGKKVEDRRKSFNIAWIRTIFISIFYLRAIQGHSWNTINLALQSNVLLPESFTEFVYHVGNVEELRSKMNNGFIPVNTTPQMPWEYNERHMKKWPLERVGWINTVWEIGTQKLTTISWGTSRTWTPMTTRMTAWHSHINDCVALHNANTHKYFHWERALTRTK